MTPRPGDRRVARHGRRVWAGRYYLYEVEVYVPSTGRVERNLVTDPYSLSLSTNSARQIVDLGDRRSPPAGTRRASRRCDAPEDIVALRAARARLRAPDDDRAGGSSAARSRRSPSTAPTACTTSPPSPTPGSRRPPAAGVRHRHRRGGRRGAPGARPGPASGCPPDSEQQQAARPGPAARDGFNWGYDPLHYTAPEGSYATDPDGPARIVEFREMVRRSTRPACAWSWTWSTTTPPRPARSQVGARPHRARLLPPPATPTATSATTTCCAEHGHRARHDGEADDRLGGHLGARVQGRRLPLRPHGPPHEGEHAGGARGARRADAGRRRRRRLAIYLYGEGWNFGEVANDARGVQATQRNMAGTGIGTFSDRLRDAVRGGGPFDGGTTLPTRASSTACGTTPTSWSARRRRPQRDGCCCRPTGSASAWPATSRTTRSSTATAATDTGPDVDYNGAAGRLQRRPAGGHQLRRGPRQPDAVRQQPVQPPAGHVDRRPGAGAEPGPRLRRARPGRAVLPRRRRPAAVQVAGPQQLQLGRLVQPARLHRARPTTGAWACRRPPTTGPTGT